MVKTFANGGQSYHRRSRSKAEQTNSSNNNNINRYFFIESHLSQLSVSPPACVRVRVCVSDLLRAQEHTYTHTHTPLNQAAGRTCCACYAEEQEPVAVTATATATTTATATVTVTATAKPAAFAQQFWSLHLAKIRAGRANKESKT